MSLLLIIFGVICVCSRRARHTLLTPVTSSWTKDSSYLKASPRGSSHGRQSFKYGADMQRGPMSQRPSTQPLRSHDSTIVPAAAAAAGEPRGDRGADDDAPIMSGLRQHPVTFNLDRDSWRASQTYTSGHASTQTQLGHEQPYPSPLVSPTVPPGLARTRLSGQSVSDSIYDSAQSHPPTPGLYATGLSPAPGRENRSPEPQPRSPLPVQRTQVPYIVFSGSPSGPRTPTLVHPDAAARKALNKEASRATVEEASQDQSRSESDYSDNRFSGEGSLAKGTGLKRTSQMSGLSHGTMSGQETSSSAFSWDEGASDAHTAREPGFGLSAFSSGNRIRRPRRLRGDPG